MSLDLFQQEANDRLTALPPVQNVDPGMWDGFIRGTGMATMKGFAKAARAVDLLGAVVPIAQDTFTGGTEAQDKYFAGHDAIFGRAVDYWTPKPQEVGMAGEVMGSLISLIPFVAFQPTQPLAIAATQLGTAEDLVNAGVTSGKANVVGAVQGATLATGIWMPILGKNLWQRAVIGGAGFNLVQGTAARAVSGAILADTPAKDMFKAFDAEAMTLDVLMGLAFGGLVHLSPTQRAQGAAAWDKIESWAKNLNPSDKAAIATLREAQHLNVDSTPGKPMGTPDIEAHVNRMRAAIDQLATDQPVNVEDIKKETGVPPIRTIGVPIRIEGNDPKTVTYSRLDDGRLERTITYDDGDTQTDQLANKANGDEVWVSKEGYGRGNFFPIQLDEGEAAKAAAEDAESMGAPRIERQPEAPRFEPDPERTAQAEATVRDLQAAAETVRAEEGIPPPPQEPPRVVQSVRRTIEEELARAGRPAEEAAAGAAIWDAFYTTMAKRIGTTVDQLWAQFPLPRITNELPPEIQPIYQQLIYGTRADQLSRAFELMGLKTRRESSRQSASEYVLVESPEYTASEGERGKILKIRVSDHELPRAYEQPDFDVMVTNKPHGGALWNASGNWLDAVGYVSKIFRVPPKGNAARYLREQTARRDIEQRAKEEAKRIHADNVRNNLLSAASKLHAWATNLPAGASIAEARRGGYVASKDGKLIGRIDANGDNPAGVGHPWYNAPYPESASRPLAPAERFIDKQEATAKRWGLDSIAQVQDALKARMQERPAVRAEESGSPEEPAQSGGAGGDGGSIDQKPDILFQGGKSTWYKSALGEAITNLNMKQGDAKAWLQALKGLGSKGVKAEEVKWSGIEEWLQLQEGKITKEQVQEFLANNGVKVEEVMLGGSGGKNLGDPKIAAEVATLDRLGFEPKQHPDDNSVLAFWDRETDDVVTAEDLRRYALDDERLGEAADAADRIEQYWYRDSTQADPTKYGTYQLPGGENYRELLLTLPAKETPRETLGGTPREMTREEAVQETGFDEEQFGPEGTTVLIYPQGAYITRRPTGEYDAIVDRDERSSRNLDEIEAFVASQFPEGRKPNSADFQSSHFDQPNILAHVRFNERTDAEGKRVLFIEEFQSDWAQQGKRRGFAGQGEETAPPVRQLEAMSGQWTYGNELTRPGTNTTGTITQWEGTGWADNGRDFPEGGRGYRATFQNQRATFDTFEAAEAWLVDAMAPIIQSLANGAKVGKIPAAPFVQKTDAWVGLTLKRMIAYAAENGFDRVAWTRGEQQVERYTGALRKAVDVIEWTKTDKGVRLVGYKGGRPDQYYYAAADENGFEILDQNGVAVEEGFPTAAEAARRVDQLNAEEGKGQYGQKVVDTTEKEDALSDAIGKAMAEKIISDPNQSGTIEGENIRIDSTGMAGFYDRIVPKVANEVLKKLGGGKVADVSFERKQKEWEVFDPRDGRAIESFDTERQAQIWVEEHPGTDYARHTDGWNVADTSNELSPTRQQGFDITQSMKEKVEGGLPLFQKTKGTERGYMSIGDEGRVIGLLEGADASTFIHESGHFFLEILAEICKLPDVPAAVRADLDTALTWMGLKDPAKWVDMTLDEKRPYHEKFGRGFEQYMREGKAPSEELKGVFQRFRDWLVELYKSAKSLNVKLNDDIRGVFNRMLADQTRNPSTEAPPAPSVRPGSPPPPGVSGEAQAGAEAQMRAMLQDMALNETGWAQEGGKLLDRGELGTGKPSFTTWIPKAEWWPARPDKKLNAAKVQEAVRKYLAGEKLKPGEQRTVDYMIDIANARNKGIDTVGGMEEYKALAEEAWDEGLDPTTENVVDLDLVARAAAIDEGYVERAALKYENDDAAFRGELEMLIYETERTQAAEAAGRSKAGEQKKAGSQGAEGQKPTDIVRAEADLIVEKNPDMPITVGVNQDGTPLTMTAREFLDQARAEAELNRADIPLLEVAAQCLLGMS